MENLRCQREFKRLASLSDASLDHLTRYLFFLESRQYADNTLRAIIDAIKRFIDLLSPQRRRIVGRDITRAVSGDFDCFISAAQAKKLSPITINVTLSLLGEFFEFLREVGAIKHQPILRRRHRILAPVPRPKPMTEAEVVAFFRVIDALRDRTIFLLMLRCGLRVSEAISLKWEDLDFDGGTLRINNSKGQMDRIVYLSPDLETTLRQWAAGPKKSFFLFPAPRDPRRSLTTRHIYRLMLDYLKVAGVSQHYSPHCLRHTFATQMLNAGVRLEVLKELMGHRSLDMTLRYTELYDTTKREQYDSAMSRIEKRQAGLRR
jgi:site-specific recombinase XerD